MAQANSYLSLMPESKLQIKSFTAKLKAEILSGEVHPLGVAVSLKAMEDVISTLRKDKQVQAEIIARIDGNRTEYGTAILEVRNKATYDYSSDSEWTMLDKQIADLSEKIKARQEFLKLVKEPIVIEGTGEIVEPLKVKHSETLYVSFKK